MRFDHSFFKRVDFSTAQIQQFFENGKRDLQIAKKSELPEVKFVFTYNAFLKAGITLLAAKGYKVRSVKGHHMKILEKTSQILRDEDIFLFGNVMRSKRNRDLYEGGMPLTEKESEDYLRFVEKVMQKIKNAI